MITKNHINYSFKSMVVAIFVMLIVMVGCKTDDPQVPDTIPNATGQLSDEVYDIYKSLFISRSSMTYIINSTDTNLNCSDLLQINGDSIKLTTDIINECIGLNSQEYFIESSKMESGGVVILDRASFNSMTYEEIIAQYGGYTALGHPVIYDNGNRAVVESFYYCGPLCASWVIHYCEKTNGYWFPAGFYVFKVSK